MGTNLFYNICVNRQPSDTYWFDPYPMPELIEAYIIIIQEHGTTIYYTKIFSQDSLFIHIISIFLFLNILDYLMKVSTEKKSNGKSSNHWSCILILWVDVQMRGEAKEIWKMLRNAELKVEDRFYNRTISVCRF